jgi:hypothetical protein
MHFWMLGIVYEPHQSYARMALAKWLKLVSLMDDICDNYSTTEEYDCSFLLWKGWASAR